MQLENFYESVTLALPVLLCILGSVVACWWCQHGDVTLLASQGSSWDHFYVFADMVFSCFTAPWSSMLHVNALHRAPPQYVTSLFSSLSLSTVLASPRSTPLELTLHKLFIVMGYQSSAHLYPPMLWQAASLSPLPKASVVLPGLWACTSSPCQCCAYLIQHRAPASWVCMQLYYTERNKNKEPQPQTTDQSEQLLSELQAANQSHGQTGRGELRGGKWASATSPGGNSVQFAQGLSLRMAVLDHRDTLLRKQQVISDQRLASESKQPEGEAPIRGPFLEMSGWS